MASPMDTDVTMVQVKEEPSSSSSTGVLAKKGKRFEIKKWNAILLWIIVLFAGTTSWISALNVRLTKLVLLVRNAQLRGGSAIMRFTFTVSADGSRLVKSVHWITVNGNSRSTVTRSSMRLDHWTRYLLPCEMFA
nr:zinc finger, RING/FYVE/PHD-type [Tanacetum cinerariifolium]